MTEVRYGDWIEEQLLGEGAFAEVHRARHAVSGTLAALKVLREEWRRRHQLRSRFTDEAETSKLIGQGAAKIPSLPMFLGADTEADVPWIAVEFIKGRPLADVLTDGQLPGGRMVPRDAATRLSWSRDVAVALCEALSFAHRRGIVHRDVKPENLLCAEDGRYVCIDFGIARDARGKRHTREDMPSPMTPEYAAPELLESRVEEALETALDTYAVGCVLYELITGDLPPVGTATTTSGSVWVPRSGPLDLAGRDVPDEVRRLVLACTAVEAALRPSMGAIVAILKGADIGGAILPPGGSIQPPPGAPMGGASMGHAHAVGQHAPAPPVGHAVSPTLAAHDPASGTLMADDSTGEMTGQAGAYGTLAQPHGGATGHGHGHGHGHAPQGQLPPHAYTTGPGMPPQQTGQTHYAQPTGHQAYPQPPHGVPPGGMPPGGMPPGGAPPMGGGGRHVTEIDPSAYRSSVPWTPIAIGVALLLLGGFAIVWSSGTPPPTPAVAEVQEPAPTPDPVVAGAVADEEEEEAAAKVAQPVKRVVQRDPTPDPAPKPKPDPTPDPDPTPTPTPDPEPTPDPAPGPDKRLEPYPDPAANTFPPTSDAGYLKYAKDAAGSGDRTAFQQLADHIAENPAEAKRVLTAATAEKIIEASMSFDRLPYPKAGATDVIASFMPTHDRLSCSEAKTWLRWTYGRRAENASSSDFYKKWCRTCTAQHPDPEVAHGGECMAMKDHRWVNGRCVHKDVELFPPECP